MMCGSLHQESGANDAFRGSIWLKLDFKPLRPEPPGGDEAFPTRWTGGRLQIESESATLCGGALRLNADPTGLFDADHLPGKYGMIGHLSSSIHRFCRPKHQEDLGIDFPYGQLTTSHLSFVKTG
jgi:hypothetical protein